MNQKMTDMTNDHAHNAVEEGLSVADTSTDADEQMAEVLWESVLSGAQLKDIRGIPNELMEGIYAYAYDFYQRGRLDDAEIFFRFLCLYDMKNPEYVMGLGATFQLRKLYQKALDAYALAFAMSSHDYRPMFHSGQCNLLMKKTAKARRCFEIVLESSSDFGLNAKAQAYLDAMGEVGAQSTAAEKEQDIADDELAAAMLGFTHNK